MMMRRFTTLLLLALLGFSALVPQGRAEGIKMTLCSAAGGVQTITLDAQGNPMPESQHCPDCTAAASPQDLPPPLRLPMPNLAQSLYRGAIPARLVPGRAISCPHARAPPLMDVI